MSKYRRTGHKYGPETVSHEELVPNWDERKETFEAMDLPEQLIHGIYSYGFKQPSEIQSLAVEPILIGRDVLAQAQSGTGKTGAFSIGVLARINPAERSTQALLLSPTRELAQQTYQFIVEVGSKIQGLRVELFKGGTSVSQDQETAISLPHIIVATPGRAKDLITTGHLRMENLGILVLDEADQMFQEGFLEQIQEIYAFIPTTAQVLLFSATMPYAIYKIAEEILKDPAKILVRAEKLTLEGIKQFMVDVGYAQHKIGTLIDMYEKITVQKAVIFCNSKQTVDYVTAALNEAGHTVSCIHSGLDQKERDLVMRQFRLGATRVLVSTDLLGRGIDVQQITLVINFELPRDLEQYIHRIGRSGRYGRKGVAINIIDNSEMRIIQGLRQTYSTQIETLPDEIDTILKEINNSQA